jgi:hypothetical protein
MKENIVDTIVAAPKKLGVDISKGSVTKSIPVASVNNKPVKMDIVATPKQQKVGLNFRYNF